MPDIDIDFCYERRGEVIDYVTKKYGSSNVAQIITFGSMQAKAAVLDRRVPRPGAVPMQLGDPPKRRRNSLLVLVFPAVSDDPLDLTA